MAGSLGSRRCSLRTRPKACALCYWVCRLISTFHWCVGVRQTEPPGSYTVRWVFPLRQRRCATLKTCSVMLLNDDQAEQYMDFLAAGPSKDGAQDFQMGKLFRRQGVVFEERTRPMHSRTPLSCRTHLGDRGTVLRGTSRRCSDGLTLLNCVARGSFCFLVSLLLLPSFYQTG